MVRSYYRTGTFRGASAAEVDDVLADAIVTRRHVGSAVRREAAGVELVLGDPPRSVSSQLLRRCQPDGTRVACERSTVSSSAAS